MKTRYYIGTAGWSYKDWVRVFYPKQQDSSFDYLTFYSQYFNITEVNSTYYTYITPSIASGWLRKVDEEDDFVFTVKLNGDFTHKRKFSKENVLKTVAVLDILAKNSRLNGILMQFPYSFVFNGESVRYVGMLSEIFGMYNRFIEIRHSSWNNKDAEGFMSENDLTFTTVDQPQLGEAMDFKPVITNGRGYFRLHGRNGEGWKKSISDFGRGERGGDPNERYRYLYSLSELTDIAQKIKEKEGKLKEINVIMNNHPGGGAVVNALEMIILLGEKLKKKIPSSLKKEENKSLNLFGDL
ncbi:MAG: DUF72 domain-containing protein [Ignavibacteriales bacterium]|jgi:uncharacterized protein YecE (DUF72 family)|nr:DUF72 domain-containing protein [Ignavibacteriaceae bacterium]NLH60940.1 DUF72 domain-containing protein [Ignavibacteriales bacterium]HOJ18896.1 DUF72 domain-containing protein [Ignavibacteriaceae bacterium]